MVPGLGPEETWAISSPLPLPYLLTPRLGNANLVPHGPWDSANQRQYAPSPFVGVSSGL